MENNLGNLADYMGPRKLDANIVKDKEMQFACINIEKKEYDDKVVLKLSFQNNEEDFHLNFNKTNLDVLAEYMQDEDMKQLTEFVGCVFTFDTRKVTNPNTGKLMDSLIVHKIER